MGANNNAGMIVANLLTGGIVGAVDTVNKKGGAGGLEGLASMLTLGTSQIKTGGGQYGDETVADVLYPKAINDLLLTDRQKEREAKDKAAADEKAALDAEKPPPPMDFSDPTLQAARSSSLLRLVNSRGRSSSFLTGSRGVPMGKKTALGG